MTGRSFEEVWKEARNSPETQQRVVGEGVFALLDGGKEVTTDALLKWLKRRARRDDLAAAPAQGAIDRIVHLYGRSPPL